MALMGSSRATIPMPSSPSARPRAARATSRDSAFAVRPATSTPLTITCVRPAGARWSAAASLAWLSETWTTAVPMAASRRSRAR